MNYAAAQEPAFISAWRHAPAIGFTSRVEWAGGILFLFLFSQGLLGPLLASTGDPEDSAILRLMWLPIYAITAALVLARPGALVRMLAANWLLLGLVALTAISTLWSIDPDTTLRRSFALAMTTLFGFWLASRWSWRALILLIASTFALLALASYAVALAMPSIGIDQAVHAGAWKGVWWEKNTLGAMMGRGAIAGFAAMVLDPKRRWLWFGVALACSGLVLLSTSKTALLALVLGSAGVLGIALCRRGFAASALTLFLLITGGMTIVLIGLLAPVEALEALGRDATLTGRTDIWAVLAEQIRNAPWTGYGYMAFWVVEDGPVFWVRQQTDWPVPTAHNGWLETALAIGLPGVTLMALVFLRAMLRAVRRLFCGPETYWTLPFLAMLALFSISESNLLLQNSITWVLFVATVAKLADRRARTET